MSIRNLLLGSIAAAGLSAGGAQAADLGVLTSLDVCDSLGLTGLTISSDAACVQISGFVKYSYEFGDFDTTTNTNDNDWESTVESRLKFVATSDSSFGKASATIRLTDKKQSSSANGTTTNSDKALNADQAYVSIGDTTVIAAGLKGSVYNDGQDEPLTWLGLYNSDTVNTGVSRGSTKTGGNVIQLTSDLGNGLSIGAGAEDLTGKGTAVGVISYTSDSIAGHFSYAKGHLNDSGASGAADDWSAHIGMTATFQNFKFVVADALAKDDYNALISASATFDLFTLAVGYETLKAGDHGYAASASYTVSEGVTINVGGRWNEDKNNKKKSEIAAGLTAAVTESLTLSAKIGNTHDDTKTKDVSYVKAGVTWSPGGDFTTSVSGTAKSDNTYSISTEFKKSF